MTIFIRLTFFKDLHEKKELSECNKAESKIEYV